VQHPEHQDRDGDDRRHGDHETLGDELKHPSAQLRRRSPPDRTLDRAANACRSAARRRPRRDRCQLPSDAG
jgi:hypothetical protein